MEHTLNSTRNHWMPPLGKCLHHIAPVAAMVNEFDETTQNTNINIFLATIDHGA